MVRIDRLISTAGCCGGITLSGRSKGLLITQSWIYGPHSKWGRGGIANESRVCFRAIIRYFIHYVRELMKTKQMLCVSKVAAFATHFNGIRNWQW